jgi:hypothetical protein
MADHNAESLTGLRTTDAAIANLAYDVYGKAASDEQIERAKKALEAKTHKVSVVNSKQEAVELLAKSIPSGASIMNAGSRTLVINNIFRFKKICDKLDQIIPADKLTRNLFSLTLLDRALM